MAEGIVIYVDFRLKRRKRGLHEPCLSCTHMLKSHTSQGCHCKGCGCKEKRT